MKIYLVESLSNSYYILFLKKAKQKNILFSYLSGSKDIEKVEKVLDILDTKNIMIDSGAFSAWTLKTQIDIDKYADFCQRLQKRPENFYFVNLDVIPGVWGLRPTKDEIEHSAQQGWKNMEYLESKGIKVLHIFHQHEDFKWLDKLVEHQEYIGISPANDLQKGRRMQWLDKVFSRIKATRKTHGFGVAAKEIIYRYPWYSLDSVSWKAPCMWGRSSTVNFNKIGLIKTPSEFMRKQMINEIKEWQKLEKEATQLWANRGVTWKD